jgi:hypothetical protein
VNASCVTFLVGPWLYAKVPAWSRSPGFWQRYFEPFDYVSNLWHPATYFASPNKRGYRGAATPFERLMAILPADSHYFDSDGKGQYPFGLYYQGVLKERTDVHVHAIFGPELDQARVHAHARELIDLLNAGKDVFISSAFWPERLVLDEAYALLVAEDGRVASSIARISTDELEKGFPHYGLERVPLDDAGEHYCYRFVSRRGIAAPGAENRLSGLRLEGESLTSRTLHGHKVPVRHDIGPGWSGGQHLMWIDNEIGDVLEVEFPVSESGHYQLDARMTRSVDFGIWDAKVDEHTAYRGFDGYAPRPAPVDIGLGEYSFEKGSHRLVFTITGANPSSIPLRGLGIDFLTLKRTQ